MTETLKIDRGDDGVVTLTLNRPEAHNALDAALIAGLGSALSDMAADDAVRVVVLAAAGASFCAGADLGWMRESAARGRRENLAEAEALANLMATLDRIPKATVALVQGAVHGGGLGLVAACDIALAAATARFALTEVRLGLVPAVIAPYVVRAIGSRQARRYFLTGEKFSAVQARDIGLVHEVVSDTELGGVGARLVGALAEAGPRALVAAKELINEVEGRPIDTAMRERTARRIADLRASEEGREGIAAFLERRPPRWRVKGS